MPHCAINSVDIVYKKKSEVSYRLAVDIGTTNLKVVLFDNEFNDIEQVTQGYKTNYRSNGFAEQSIAEIYQALEDSISWVVGKHPEITEKIKTINFSSAMHSIILLDNSMNPLTNSIIWADNRAIDEVESFKNSYDWLAFYQNTGTPIHAMSPFAKLLWFKNGRQISGMNYCCGIKELLIYKLTNEFVMDYSLASSTGLFNIHTMVWDKQALTVVGIDERMLPNLVDVTYQLKINSSSFLEKSKLSSITEIIIGASDGCLANLGSGALLPGETTLSIGTSGAIRMTVGEPLLDPQGRTFCYYLCPGKWIIGGAVNNGGNILTWLNQLIFSDNKNLYELIKPAIQLISTESKGLFFIPHLHGERAPYWDGSLTASFIGLLPMHTKLHMLKATLEGVAMNLKEVWQLLQDLAGDSTKIIASGGFVNSPEWTALITDIFGVDIYIQPKTEHSCLGAVLLSENSSSSLPFSEKFQVIHPNAENKVYYAQLYKEYRWYVKSMIDMKKNFAKDKSAGVI